MISQKTYSMLDKWRMVYFYIFLSTLLLRSVNLYSLLPSKPDSIIFSILAMIGLVFLGIDIYKKIVEKEKFTYNIWLLLFLAAFLISTIVNMKYGILSNLKLLMWTAILVLNLYEFSKRSYFLDYFYRIINVLVLIMTFLMSLVSLGMYLFQYSYIHYYGEGSRDRIRIGFSESRLFGIFGDPNYGATIAVVAIILSLYYLFNKKNNKLSLPLQIVLSVNILIQVSYVILSGSRSGILTCYLIMFIFVFIYVMNLSKIREMNIFLKVILGIVCAVFFSVVVIVAFDVLKYLLEKLPTLFHTKKIPTDRVSLVREDVAENSDISNMRFSIWKSAIEIFETTWLFGTSPRNLILYAKDVLPETYISIKGIVTHNAYINILVSTGIFGIFSIAIYFIQKAIQLLKVLFNSKITLSSYYLPYFLIIIAIAFLGLFNNEVILVNTIGSFIFWLYLGRLVGFINNQEDIKREIR